MARKLFALALACMLAISAAGCGGQKSGSSVEEASVESSTETAYTLGIVEDSDTTYEDYEAALGEYGYSTSDFDDIYEEVISNEEELQIVTDELISYGCSVILFTAKGSADFAETYDFEESNVELLFADSAYESAAPVISVTKEYTLSCGNLESQRFYGDVAWTGLVSQETNEEAVGLINKRGEVLYINENGDEPTPFINGLSAVYTDTGFVIVNTDGQEVYTCTDERMTLLGQADDGTFIIEKHETGFDVNTRTFCILNSSLELEDTGIELGNTLDFNRIITIEDGVYLMDTDGRNSSILNLNNGTWLKPSSGYWNFAIGDDGKYLCDPYAYYNVFVPVNILSQASSPEELEEMIQNSDSCIHVDAETVHHGAYKSWHGGTYYNNRTYYDVDGNIVLTMPTFSEGISYEGERNFSGSDGVSNFSGGYAALFLFGADNECYVTVVDENGNIQYDPVPSYTKFGGVISVYDLFGTYKGYIFSQNDGDIDIIDPTGEHKNLGDDLSGLIGGEYTKSTRFISISIGGDFIWFKNKFVSVDGSITIEAATANYNENGELIYTDENGNYMVNSASSIGVSSSYADSTETSIDSSQAMEKDYTTPSNFSIEGKWKNVGEYTYGQVQAGAIVIFDGENCNFISPQDTYAFYKDGDGYTLDCTTLLADTLSFTVKIIDDDNIDIYNGSNCLELTRVS